jgi:hypothetical protein
MPRAFEGNIVARPGLFQAGTDQKGGRTSIENFKAFLQAVETQNSLGQL